MLAELKVISSCPTRYQRAPRAPETAVKRRADMLPREYRKKAVHMDTEYGGVPEGEVGPVARKLASFPRLQSWVFGAWCEASPDIHTLVHTIAQSRRQYEQVLEGRGGRRRMTTDKAALSLLTGQIRRTLSLEVARAQSRLLLDRLEVLGSGGVEAARRRSWEAMEGRMMARESRAHMLGMQSGRAVYRRGEIFLQ